MNIVRDLSSIEEISNPEIRLLVEQRINDLVREGFDIAEIGYFLVVEPGDTLHTLTEQLGFPIVSNRFTGIRYDQAGFTPSFEFVEEFHGCYDMAFVISDDGFGVEVFISKAEAILPDLLTMCQKHAITRTPKHG